MTQTFDGQRQGERIIFLFRRHIMTARRGFYVLFLMLVLGFIPMLVWPTDSRMIYVLLGFCLLGILSIFYYYILWYFTVYIVTNERLRQVSQKGFFKKTVIDLDLSKVQSISCQVPGFFGTVLGYGTIVIQTAVGDLNISSASHPERVYNKLQDAVDMASRKYESDKKEN